MSDGNRYTEKILLALMAIVFQCSACSAQFVTDAGAGAALQPQSGQSISSMTAGPPDLSAALRKKDVGKALLISGGAMTVTGAGLYTAALLSMGEGGPVQSFLAISGVTLAGASVGMYVAGAIVFVSGRKTEKALAKQLSPQLALTVSPSGIALRF